MQVTVAIPTYKTRNTIFKLLDSLKAQSFKKFGIMVVYGPWPGCKDVLDSIKESRGLDIELIKQDAGLFEEALNTIYRKADGDIVIHTDDDAYASRNWIKDHVELHKKHKEVGIATGIVEERELPDGTPLPFFTRLLNEQKWRMNKHTTIDRPIDKRFKDYGMYIGKSGMLVDTGKKYNMIRTFKQHGVNMSWKREALRKFKLPGYTKQGGRNEAAAALEVLGRGFIPMWFNTGAVHHPLQRSDSRNMSVAKLPAELIVESVLFSYYVGRYSSYDVNLDVLKRRTIMDSRLSAMLTGRDIGYRMGYEIAKRAIENKWGPTQLRRLLKKRLVKSEAIH